MVNIAVFGSVASWKATKFATRAFRPVNVCADFGPIMAAPGRQPRTAGCVDRAVVWNLAVVSIPVRLSVIWLGGQDRARITRLRALFHNRVDRIFILLCELEKLVISFRV